MFYGSHVCDAECSGPKGCDEGRREVGRYERIQSAKQICMTCPVQPQCLDHALRADERFGLWGGMSERERRSLRVKLIREGKL